MKLLGYEDMIAGILLGIAMIGSTGKYFTLPYGDMLVTALLFIFSFLAAIDIIHELRTIERGEIRWTLFAVLWNALELVVAFHFIARYMNLAFSLPLQIEPLYAGLFFIAGGVMWLYFYFKH